MLKDSVKPSVASQLATTAQAAPTITVREAVIDLLRTYGMTTIFGNPGSTELALFLDFPDDFTYQLGLHEGISVGMADGYAQVTRRASFVNLHSAAGVGNAMGAIFTAFKNATPMVITAGQQSRSILPYDPFLFSAEATELPKPYVKYSIEPARAQDVPQALARAYHLAMQQPCGPVLVSIPADDWLQPCDPDYQFTPRQVSTRSAPQPEMLEHISTLLNQAKKPAFVVGIGVDRDNAWYDTVALAEKHKARVFTAPMCARAAFPGDHPQFAGYLPAQREKIVAALSDHDFILVIGAPAFTYHVQGHGPHVPPGARLAQIVDDPNIAAWTPEGDSLVCSIQLGVQGLLERSAPPKREMPAPRQLPPRAEPDSQPMSVAYLLQTFDEVRDPKSVIVEESPSARPVMHRYMPLYHPETFYTMSSGGLGYGMSATIGVAMGKTNERIIGLIGDGSSMYTIQAIWHAVQLNLPITYIIINNEGYAALEEFAPTFGFEPGEELVGCHLPGINFVQLAGGMGCKGVQVTDPKQLAETLKKALELPVDAGPFLVDVIVE